MAYYHELTGEDPLHLRDNIPSSLVERYAVIYVM